MVKGNLFKRVARFLVNPKILIGSNIVGALVAGAVTATGGVTELLGQTNGTVLSTLERSGSLGAMTVNTLLGPVAAIQATGNLVENLTGINSGYIRMAATPVAVYTSVGAFMGATAGGVFRAVTLSSSESWQGQAQPEKKSDFALIQTWRSQGPRFS